MNEKSLTNEKLEEISKSCGWNIIAKGHPQERPLVISIIPSYGYAVLMPHYINPDEVYIQTIPINGGVAIKLVDGELHVVYGTP